MLRKRLENSLLEFTEYFFENLYGKQFIVNHHHQEIVSTIRGIEAGKWLNVVINMPPRYSKTELAVVMWVAWTLARNPAARFMHLSYSVDLALENSSRIKELVLSDVFQDLWPLKLRDDAKSKQKWYTSQGGGVYATSTGGQITGFGAGSLEDMDLFSGGIIIDDPLKPDDARSAAMRDEINARLNNTIKSRRNNPSCTPILIIMQRLHVDDMTGFVMNGGMGEQFHQVKLQALSEDGVALWDRMHSAEQLVAMRSHDRMTFASQYQQEPVPAEGAVYQLAWFARYARTPGAVERTMVVHSWDTAYKAGQHNDPSCCTVWHVTPTLYYLAEVHHGRWEYHELRKRVFDLAHEQKPDAILIEDKASGQSLIQELKTGSILPVIAIEPDSDKETRARTTAAMVQAGRVALPNDAPWLAEYEREMMNFPNGKHDDRVDSTSQFLRWIKERGGDSDREFLAMMDRLYNR